MLKKRLSAWMGNSTTPYLNIVADRAAMWRATPEVTFSATSNSPSSAINRAKKLLSEGKIAEAAKALIDTTQTAPVCQETFDSLCSKHPDGQPVERDHSCPPPRKFSASEIECAVRRFHAGSGAGLSLLRPDHFKDADSVFVSKSLFENLARVCDLIASGRAASVAQPYLTGAFLTALLKKEGGIRPIACGDVLRRVTGRALCFSIRDLAKQLFSGAPLPLPVQLGVAVPGGCEAIPHAWREMMAQAKDDPEAVIFKVDLTNAFNNGDRATMLQQTRALLPALYPFAWYCYGEPSRLLVRGHGRFLSSAQGTQQGCPLGVVLFCLLIRLIMTEIVEEISRVRLIPLSVLAKSLSMNCWYIDDGSLSGKFWLVHLIYTKFAAKGPKYGLFLNLGKCEIAWPCGIPPLADPFPDSIRRYASTDVDIVGVPIGSSEFSSKWIVSRVHDKVSKLATSLSKLDSQSAFIILRHCASFSKMAFFLRSIPPQLIARAVAAFDCLVASLVRSFFPYKIDAASLSQLQLSTSLGGLGLRSSTLHHHAAFYSSLGSSLDLIRLIVGRLPRFSYECLDSLRTQLATQLPPGFVFTEYSQSKLSHAIDARQFESLLSSLPPLHQARLLAASRPKAGSFLFALPNQAIGTVMHSAEFNVAVAYRLGCPILPAPIQCPAKDCDKKLDIYGHHAVRCHSQGEITIRHNRLRDLVFRKCESALLQPLKEPAGMLRDCGLKPADVGIPNFIRHKPLATDLAVTDPMRADVVPRSCVPAFSACEDYAINVKHRKYSSLIKDDEIVFKAIVAETLGGWSSEAHEFFSFVAAALAKRHPHGDVKLELKRFYELLSVSLQRSNARMILTRISGVNSDFI